VGAAVTSRSIPVLYPLLFALQFRTVDKNPLQRGCIFTRFLILASNQFLPGFKLIAQGITISL